MDQPSIDGANTYFVSKEAAAMGLKVALSGLGGGRICSAATRPSDKIPKLTGCLGWILVSPGRDVQSDMSLLHFLST